MCVCVCIDRFRIPLLVASIFPARWWRGFGKSFGGRHRISFHARRNNNKSVRPMPSSSSSFYIYIFYSTEEGERERIKLSRKSFSFLSFLANIQGHGTGLYKDAEDRFDTAWPTELVDYLLAKSIIFATKLAVQMLPVHGIRYGWIADNQVNLSIYCNWLTRHALRRTLIKTCNQIRHLRCDSFVIHVSCLFSPPPPSLPPSLSLARSFSALSVVCVAKLSVTIFLWLLATHHHPKRLPPTFPPLPPHLLLPHSLHLFLSVFSNPPAHQRTDPPPPSSWSVLPHDEIFDPQSRWRAVCWVVCVGQRRRARSCCVVCLAGRIWSLSRLDSSRSHQKDFVSEPKSSISAINQFG